MPKQQNEEELQEEIQPQWGERRSWLNNNIGPIMAIVVLLFSFTFFISCILMKVPRKRTLPFMSLVAFKLW